MVGAVLAAVASALGFAVSSSIQHHAAASVPPFAASRAHHFLRALVSKPWWLFGQVLASCSFVMHAWALHLGALAIVQPIVVSGMVFAVPLRAAMSHRLPTRRELVAVVVTAIGLATFLVASNPTVGTGDPHQWVAVAITATGVAVAGALTWVATLVDNPQHRAFVMGVTAGLLFGLVAGSVKLSLAAFGTDEWSGLFTQWSTYALIVLGAWGISTNLRAYQVADLSASLPVLSIMNVSVSLLYGLAVFHEVPAHTPTALVVQVLAFAAIAVGLTTLARLSVQLDHEEHPEPATTAC
jgi:drug/metabolite transporter (DMT)-like permease